MAIPGAVWAALLLACMSGAAAWPCLAGASTADGTGGTPVPASYASVERIDVAGVGGTQAPVGEGTGGSEYGVPVASPAKPSHAPVKRTLKHSAHRSHRSRSHGRSHHTHSNPPAPPVAPAPVAPVSTSPAAPPVGVPTPAQTVSEGAVFPVRGPHTFGGPENRFGAPRGNHTHQGQDILAAEGLTDAAPLAGTIIATGNQPQGAGWYVAEHTAAGFDLFFAHCETGSVKVAAGQAVAAGAEVCLLGATGDATGPHLHFEMWVGGWQAATGHPIDPLPYLEAWEAAGR